MTVMASRSSPRRAAADLDRLLFGDALDELIGAALVLDEQLRIRIATPAARAILGFDAPIGASAATVLCGDRTKRPFAEALVAGTPFRAVIPRPRGAAGEQVRVRSLPVGDGEHPSGWVVYVSAVTGDDGEPIDFHGMWTRDARTTRPDYRSRRDDRRWERLTVSLCSSGTTSRLPNDRYVDLAIP